MLNSYKLNNITKKIKQGLITGVHALEIYSPLNEYYYNEEYGESEVKWNEFGNTVYMYYPEENKDNLNKYYPITDDTINFSFKDYRLNDLVEFNIIIKLIFIPDRDIYFMRKKSHYAEDCIVDIETLYKDTNLIELPELRELSERIYNIYHKANTFLEHGNKEKCYRLFKYCVGCGENHKWTEYSQHLFRSIGRVVSYLYGKNEIPVSIFKYVMEYDSPGIFAINDIFFGYWNEEEGLFEERNFIFPNECSYSEKIEWKKMTEILSTYYALSQLDRDHMIYHIIANDIEILEEFFNERIDKIRDEEFDAIESMTIQEVIEAMKPDDE